MKKKSGIHSSVTEWTQRLESLHFVNIYKQKQTETERQQKEKKNNKQVTPSFQIPEHYN